MVLCYDKEGSTVFPFYFSFFFSRVFVCFSPFFTASVTLYDGNKGGIVSSSNSFVGVGTNVDTGEGLETRVSESGEDGSDEIVAEIVLSAALRGRTKM